MKSFLVVYHDPHECQETELIADSVKGACRKVRKDLRKAGCHQPTITNVYELSDDGRIWKIVYGRPVMGYWWRYATPDPMMDALAKLHDLNRLYSML